MPLTPAQKSLRENWLKIVVNVLFGAAILGGSDDRILGRWKYAIPETFGR